MTMRTAKFNKYKAQKIETRDGKFASQLEFRKWSELLLMQNAGLISNLRRQVKIKLGHKVSYMADFVYYDIEKLSLVIADAKGVETKDFRVKKEWLLEKFKGFTFRTIYKDGEKWENPYETACLSIQSVLD